MSRKEKAKQAGDSLKACLTDLLLAVQKFDLRLEEEYEAKILYKQTYEASQTRLPDWKLAILKTQATQLLRARKNRVLGKLSGLENVMAWLKAEYEHQEINAFCTHVILSSANSTSRGKIPLECCACGDKWPRYGFTPAFRHKNNLFIMLCTKCYDLYDIETNMSGNFAVRPVAIRPLTKYDSLDEMDFRKYVPPYSAPLVAAISQAEGRNRQIHSTTGKHGSKLRGQKVTKLG